MTISLKRQQRKHEKAKRQQQRQMARWQETAKALDILVGGDGFWQLKEPILWISSALFTSIF